MIGRWTLRLVVLAYIGVILLLPVAVVFVKTFEPGLGAVWASVTTPAAIHACWLTLLVAAIAVPLNVVFGILTALVIVRQRVRGRRLLEALMRASPRVLGREELERLVWQEAPPDSDALRSHLHLLRSAIDKPFAIPLLHTLRGLGWQLAEPRPEAGDATS